MTKFDISVTSARGKWQVMVRGKIDSEHDTYEEAERRWANLQSPLQMFRG